MKFKVTLSLQNRDAGVIHTIKTMRSLFRPPFEAVGRVGLAEAKRLVDTITDRGKATVMMDGETYGVFRLNLDETDLSECRFGITQTELIPDLNVTLDLT